MRVTIIGNGAWGKAVYSVVARHTKTVDFWDRNSKVESDVVILAVPTEAIRKVLPFIKQNKDLIVVNSSKGVEEKSNALPYQIVSEVLPVEHYFSLMGPSFAQEVIDNMPTLVNVGYINKKNSLDIKNLFQTDYFRVRLIEGVEAIELASAFKNIYAILAGMIDGFGFGVNTRIKVILMAYEEVIRINRALGHPLPEEAVSGVIGDLMLTCSSAQSRNYSFGKRLVSSSIEDGLRLSEGVVEGWRSLGSVEHFAKTSGEKLVLAKLVLQISAHAKNPDKMKELFLEYVKDI